jgi:flagellin-like protein
MSSNRFLRAVSPIISVILMIAIVVAASLVVYWWTTGYMGNSMDRTGKAIQIQSISESSRGNLIVYVQNVGQGSIQLGQECVYVNGVLMSIISISTSGNIQALPANIPAGNTAAIEIDFRAQEIYFNIKVVSTTGAFAEGSGLSPKVNTTTQTPIATPTQTPTSIPTPSPTPFPSPTASPSPTPTPQNQEELFGYNLVGPFSDPLGSPGYTYLCMAKFQLLENGKITKISCYVQGGSEIQDAKCYIYSDNNGMPDILEGVTQENNIAGTSGAWKDFVFPSEVNLSSGYYHIGIAAQNTGAIGANIFFSNGDPHQFTYHFYNYDDPLPNPWAGSSYGQSSVKLSIYATYTPT